jgi:hypothetical protein
MPSVWGDTWLRTSEGRWLQELCETWIYSPHVLQWQYHTIYLKVIDWTHLLIDWDLILMWLEWCNFFLIFFSRLYDLYCQRSWQLAHTYLLKESCLVRRVWQKVLIAPRGMRLDDCIVSCQSFMHLISWNCSHRLHIYMERLSCQDNDWGILFRACRNSRQALARLFFAIVSRWREI